MHLCSITPSKDLSSGSHTQGVIITTCNLCHRIFIWKSAQDPTFKHTAVASNTHSPGHFGWPCLLLLSCRESEIPKKLYQICITTGCKQHPLASLYVPQVNTSPLAESTAVWLSPAVANTICSSSSPSTSPGCHSSPGHRYSRQHIQALSRMTPL